MKSVHVSITMGPKKDRNVFTLEKEFMLIELVEMRPMLWDSTAQNYRRADLKRTLWKEIVLSMGPEFTVDMVMGRWKSIRETFLDNFNRVKESKRRSSGNGTDDCYYPRWKLWSKMQFLVKTCMITASVSNISTNQMPSSLQTDSTDSTASNDSSVAVYFDVNTQKYMMIPPGTVEIPSPDNTFVSLNSSDNLEVDFDCPSLLSTPRPESAPSASSAGTHRDATLVKARPSSALGAAPFQVASTVNSGEKDTTSAELFCKRGTAKRKAGAAMDEALKIVKEMAKEPDVPISPLDSAHYFGSFVASRLRSMDTIPRKQCEDQIMTVMLKF